MLNGVFEFYFGDDLKDLFVPAKGEREQIRFSLKSSADDRKGELLQIASVPSTDASTEGLALDSGRWCLWVKSPDLFGPDMRPGCIRQIEQELSGVRCQVAAVKTSPRLLCNARYDARTFKRVTCIESVHNDTSSAGCFINASTPVDNTARQTDSLDDINRRLEALLARMDADKKRRPGTGGGGQTGGGGTGGGVTGGGNSGNNSGNPRAVTLADVTAAAKVARARFNQDQSTRDGCEAAGAAAK